MFAQATTYDTSDSELVGDSEFASDSDTLIGEEDCGNAPRASLGIIAGFNGSPTTNVAIGVNPVSEATLYIDFMLQLTW